MLHIWNEFNKEAPLELRLCAENGTVSIALTGIKESGDVLSTPIFNIKNKESMDAMVNFMKGTDRIALNWNPWSKRVQEKGFESSYEIQDVAGLPMFSIIPRYKTRTPEENELYKNHIMNCMVLVTKPGTKIHTQKGSIVRHDTRIIYHDNTTCDTSDKKNIAAVVNILFVKYPVWCTLKRPLNILVESSSGHKCLKCGYFTYGHVSINRLFESEYTGSFPGTGKTHNTSKRVGHMEHTRKTAPKTAYHNKKKSK